MVSISQFQNQYAQAVIDLVLHFQNDGTRPPVTVADQPDLLDIPGAYIQPGGNFWIATEGERLVGSIGLMLYGPEIAILKKFFVYEPYQGDPHHVGRQLYGRLLDFAKEKRVRTILLDTPRNTQRAHKFYEKAGFYPVQEAELPVHFSHPYADSDFFRLDL